MKTLTPGLSEDKDWDAFEHGSPSQPEPDWRARAEKAEAELVQAKGGTYCAYCGQEFPLDDSAAEQVSEHIRRCEKHPMRAAEARAEKAEAEALECRQGMERAVFRASDLEEQLGQAREGITSVLNLGCDDPAYTALARLLEALS